MNDGGGKISKRLFYGKLWRSVYAKGGAEACDDSVDTRQTHLVLFSDDRTVKNGYVTARYM